MYGTPPRLAQRSEEPHRRRSLRCSETRQLRASEHARRSRGWAAAEATRAGRPGRWIASLPLSLSYQSTVDLGYCRLRTLGAALGSRGGLGSSGVRDCRGLMAAQAVLAKPLFHSHNKFCKMAERQHSHRQSASMSALV